MSQTSKVVLALDDESMQKRKKFIYFRVAKRHAKPIHAITFNIYGGKKITQNVNDNFFKNKTNNQIVDDISAIAHDLHANFITF